MGKSQSQAADDFIANAVRDASNATKHTDDQLRTAIRSLVNWAWRQAALPLEREIIFDGYTLERYTSSALPKYSDHGRNTMRSRLRNVAEILLEQPRNAPLIAYGASPASRPYSEPEIIRLQSWARLQAPADRRLNAESLLALGIGAGLSGAEIIELRCHDLRLDGVGFIVVVAGRKPRDVPVLPDWSRALDQAKRTFAGEDFVFRQGRTTLNSNLITDFVARARTSVDLTCRRMHSTWIVHHLDAGTATVPLLRAAGLSSPEALARFFPFVREWPASEYAASIRGPLRH